MNFRQTLLILVTSIQVNCVLSDNNTKDSTNEVICENQKCMMKCCPFKTVLKVQNRQRICVPNNDTEIMGLNSRQLFFGNANLSNFEVKAGIFEVDEDFRDNSMNAVRLTSFNVYLMDNSEVKLEMPNAYDRWMIIPNTRFCLDQRVTVDKKTNETKLQAGIWLVMDEDEDQPSRTNVTLITVAMLVSCFFLMLVLIVYALLPELQNLCGMILMAYVGSLIAALFLLAYMRLTQHSNTACIGLTLVIYFFFLASFCWMSVMSYDIWWTFRGYAKARPIHRRGETFKFLMYCLYAWGLPLAMTIMLGLLNNRDLHHIPWFVTPKVPLAGCFIEGGEKFLYLYIPMMILILCNWVFYIMTAFNVWRLSRGTSVLDYATAGTPQSHRSHYKRFMVYLKLSVVMGLNWVLEVVSYLYPGYSVLWNISDFYNILIGVTIFLIFVCKPTILKKLVKLFTKFKKAHWRPRQMDSMKSYSSSGSESVTSQETQTLQVCTNPKGSIFMKNF